MGQLLFQYMFNPILETVNQFQYRWEKVTEYGLHYQRYAALSDASIFDAPVAITKVATGVSRIQDLFSIDKLVHPSVYLNDLFIEKCQKDTELMEMTPMEMRDIRPVRYHIGLNAMRRKILPDYFEQFFVHNARYDRGASYPESLTEEYRHWALRENHLFITSGMFLEEKTWKHGDYLLENIWMEREWNLENLPVGEWLTTPQEWKDLNLFDVLFGKLPIKQFSILDIIFGWTHGLVGNIHYDDIAKRIDDDHLSLCKIQYRAERTEPGWSVYPDEFLKFRDRTKLNMFENIIGTPDRKKVWIDSYQVAGPINTKTPNWFENVLAHRVRPLINWYENVLGQKQDSYADAHQDIFGKQVRKGFSIFPNDAQAEINRHWNVWEQLYCRRDNELTTNIFDFYGAYAENRIVSVFKGGLAYRVQDYTYLHQDVPGGRKQNAEAILSYAVNHGYKSHQTVSYQNKILGGYPIINNRSLQLGQMSWGMKTIAPVFELTLNDFGIRQKKNVFTVNGVSGFPIERTIDVGNCLSLYRLGKSITLNWTMKTNSIAMGKLIEKHWDVLSEFWTSKREHDIWLDDYFILGGVNSSYGEGGRLGWYDDPLFGYKVNKDIEWLHQLWTNSPIKHLSNSIEDDLLASMDRREVSAFNDAGVLFGKKSFLPIYIWSDESISEGSKSYKRFQIQDGVFADKSRYPFSIKDTSTMIGKIPKDFIIADSSTSIYKESKEMYFEMIYLWFAYKVSKDFIIMPWDAFPNKVKRDMEIQDLMVSGIKDRKGIPDTDAVTSAIKSAFSFVVTSSTHPPNWEDIGGFIVPVSKVRKGLMDYEIDEMAKKVFKNAFETDDAFASVIATDTNTVLSDGIVGLEKYPHKVFMDYQNEAIIKSKVYGAIHNDPIVGNKQRHKGMLEYGVWTSKGFKLLQVQPQEWLEKNSHEGGGTTADDIWAAQGYKHLSAFEQESLIKDGVRGSIFDDFVGTLKESANASVFQEYWLEKFPSLCYYSYGQWLSKDNPSLMTGEDEFAFKDKRKGMLSFVSPIIKGPLRAWYEDCFFGDSVIRQGELAAELEWLEKTRRKCGIHPNDFGNWAWVYETPDPFQKDTFGIDELLLPENDTHYEQFEDLIFDRHYMRPRNPVKEISDTQWIAKYPIKHPTEKWADVAINYDASAIDWENYYGIETSVMHDMFLRYYRIWQAKMFEFSTMTMQQSVNLMLEYLWAWIPEYYPIGKLEEAYRVFKLIRWFGEAAIINNSQYIISYEYANGGMKVKEDKRTGKKLPWDIYGIETDLKDHHGGNNDTMFIDRQQFVIRNNPIYVGVGPAWVEFTLIAKRNTTISFTLMNTIGSVNIYVDGELKSVYPKTAKVVIPVQYTGDEVVVRVEKTKQNNLNNQFMIANLQVPEQDFDGLSIEFDPQLRAGNKPLNEIAQKLIAYAMLHDERDKAWDAALKANLGVSEVYKKMTRYWDDHHAGKIKGKRLTIKQV